MKEHKKPHKHVKKEKLRKKRIGGELVGFLATGPLIFILIILFLLAANYTITSLINHEKDEHEIPAVAQKEVKKLDIGVSSLNTTDGDGVFTSAEDEEYVILRVSVIQNLGQKIWLSPLQQSYIQDKDGTVYNLKPVSMEEPFDAHEYESGQQASGDVSYLVKKNLESPKWCYEIEVASVKDCVALDLNGH